MAEMGECATTRDVLAVLGPMAAQVMELKETRGTPNHSYSDSVIKHLSSQCQSLNDACDLLASRLEHAAHTNKDDLLLKHAAEVRCHLKDVTKELATCTYDLQKDGEGLSRAWQGVLAGVERLLEGVTAALISWEKAALRDVTSAASYLKAHLSHLQNHIHISTAVPDFKNVVSSASVLLRRVAEHRRTLFRRPQQEALWHSGQQVIHSLHLLAHSAATAVTPHIATDAKVGVGLACERVCQLLDDLTSQLEPDADMPDLDEPGSFTKQIDRVFEEVDKYGRKGEVGNVGKRLKMLLEGILRHCLAVAHCGGHSGDANIPSPHIMALADKVLRQLKVVITLEHTTTTTPTTNGSSSNDSSSGSGAGKYNEMDLKVALESLADTVEQLEQSVNTCLVTLIVQTFADPLAPLNTLLAAVTKEAEAGVEVDKVEFAVSSFDIHTDAIFQASGFATACTSNRRCVREIRAHLATLEWLEGVLVPALMTSMRAHTHTHMQNHTLADHWKRAVLGLRECLDEILDPAAFVMVTRREVQKLWGEVRDQLYTQNTQWLQEKVNRIVALTSHILELSSSTSMQSSWLPHHTVQDLKIALREVKGGLARVKAAPTMLSHHRSLLKRLQLSLTLLSRLSTTLEAGSLHHGTTPHHHSPQHNDKDSNDDGDSWKLSEEEKLHLITTNIESVPTDVASITTIKTPPQPPPPPPPHSPHRLGEGRDRPGRISVIAVSGACSDTLPCDTSLDITRFLSRSSTVFSSTRGSRRNFSLKVKEINIDIEAALQVGGAALPLQSISPYSHQQNNDERKARVGDDGVREWEESGLEGVSALINNEVTGSPLSTNSTSPLTPEEELSAVLESLTSLIGDLSGLPSSSPPIAIPKEASKGEVIRGNSEVTRNKSWMTFQDEAWQEGTPIKGIVLQNASFAPVFPEINPGEEQQGEVVFREEDRQEEEEIREGSPLDEVWKDFTAILESKTPRGRSLQDRNEGLKDGETVRSISQLLIVRNSGKDGQNGKESEDRKGSSKGKDVEGKRKVRRNKENVILNFTNNFTPLHSSSSSSLSASSLNKQTDLSDTPFVTQPSSSLKLPSSSSYSSSSSSSTPSSCNISTSQRLYDLQALECKLEAVKGSLAEEV